MATIPTFERALAKASLAPLQVKVSSFDMLEKLILSGRYFLLTDTREMARKKAAMESFMAGQLVTEGLISTGQAKVIRYPRDRSLT